MSNIPIQDSTLPRKRRIATILPSLLPTGGVERLVISQTQEYLARGFDADLVFLDESHDVSEAVPHDCRTFDLKASRFRGALAPLVRYLRQERPDAIHAAMWPLTSVVAAARVIAGSRARLVVSDHNPLSLQYAGRGRVHRMLLRASLVLTYPLAHGRVGVSSGVADDLARLSGLRRDRFSVIHNPVVLPDNHSGHHPAAEAAWDGWNGKRIITVGRLKAQKNHRLLVRAFRRLLADTDARLMILGVGELADEIAREVDAAGLRGKVLMPGHVNDPAPYYRSADLFVLSSDYEGFGIVLIEALSCGLPVVSTDCPGGPREILAEGRYGRLVPVRDEEALAIAMAETLAAPPDADSQRVRAADFTVQRLTGSYLDLLFPDGQIRTPATSNASPRSNNPAAIGEDR